LSVKDNVRKLAKLSNEKQVKITGDILERLLDSPNGDSIIKEFADQKVKKPKGAVQEVKEVFIQKVNTGVDIVTNQKVVQKSVDKETKSATCNIL
jgi:hypothetical protein